MRHDLRPIRRGKGPRQRTVVEVRRDAEARVERTGGGGAALREEERIGVDRRRQLVLGLLRRLAVQERDLGEREQQARIAVGLDHGSMETRDRGLGVFAELVEEAPFEENVAGRAAELARRDDASREIPVRDRTIDADRSHRNGTGSEGQAESAEQGEPRTAPRSTEKSHQRGLSDIRGNAMVADMDLPALTRSSLARPA
jgi:hypothetical protein